LSDLTVVTTRGAITISRDVVAEIVAETAARCYGVVGLTTGSRVGKLLRRAGVTVGGTAEALKIGLHVVVEYGLNLAEVAATIRSQITYDVERLTGLKVGTVEVFVEDVRVSA
jgi:uncharacterized alkaline shock family protein YloU